MFEIDDNELMKKIVQGNHDAFAELVQKYTKYFYAITYRYVSNKDVAQDIIQQAFLKLWECPYKFDEKLSSFKTWFAKLVINLCLDYNRKNRYDCVSFEDNIADASSIITSEEEKQRYILLEQSIKKLPTNQQTAINLGFYQDISYKEVAQIMKVSEMAVKSLIMRAKENIKKDMKENGYV